MAVVEHCSTHFGPSEFQADGLKRLSMRLLVSFSMKLLMHLLARLLMRLLITVHMRLLDLWVVGLLIWLIASLLMRLLMSAPKHQPGVSLARNGGSKLGRHKEQSGGGL